MANPDHRLANLVSNIRDKLRLWPADLPLPTVVLIHESYVPQDFDPEKETLEGLTVLTTLQIRKNSIRLAYLNEHL
jgi:hypothetical protein